MSPEPPPVLCAEDEDSDALILRTAFEKAGLSTPLRIVRDGQEAVDYLSGAPPYDDRNKSPLPVLLLLDLKMPRKSGFDVLAWLATRPDLEHIPIIVLSSSSAEADIRKAKQMGVREYHVKPIELAEYVKIVQGLYARWLAAKPGKNCHE